MLFKIQHFNSRNGIFNFNYFVMKNTYLISAKTVEEFTKIEAKIEPLSIAVKSQIESAYESFDIVRIRLKKSFSEKIDLLLPIDLIDITISEIEIIAFNSTYSFTMEKNSTQTVRITFTKP